MEYPLYGRLNLLFVSLSTMKSTKSNGTFYSYNKETDFVKSFSHLFKLLKMINKLIIKKSYVVR